MWKRQPDGGFAGLGMSPLRMTRRRARSVAGIRHRHRRQQRDGVRMERVLVERGGRRDLDDLAEVHHGHAVGDVADDREVVGDEQVGQPEVVLEALEQVDDLRLDRHVEGADRLVADDQVGLHGERPGDPDPLPLAAAELVRVALDEGRIQAHELEQLRDPRGPRPAGGEMVDAQRLGEDLAHGLARIEAGVRVLEDHLELAPPAPQLLAAERQQVLRRRAGSHR